MDQFICFLISSRRKSAPQKETNVMIPFLCIMPPLCVSSCNNHCGHNIKVDLISIHRREWEPTFTWYNVHTEIGDWAEMNSSEDDNDHYFITKFVGWRRKHRVFSKHVVLLWIPFIVVLVHYIHSAGCPTTTTTRRPVHLYRTSSVHRHIPQVIAIQRKERRLQIHWSMMTDL